MQLTKLEIKGFKSFGDKVTVNFNEGVTAIVGPNGCGKSNVVDAMRWVLGEQSTRNLRSDKMENIIFNGTKDRKPANLAEVSLTFDNTKNILPTDFATVTITRKLYRNGESEYRLNDVKCRLKDITDLFLDTGIGSDTYSIIELKMIDELINNKDHSRRKLFEEASGISKYKVRKKQTLSKLKDTEVDLSRVDDLLLEINKNLKSLESQAKKADRYFQLKAQYRESSIALTYYKLENFQAELDRIQSQEAKHQRELQEIVAKTEAKETALRVRKEDILTKEKNLAKQQKTTQEYITKIRNHESDKKLKNAHLEHLKERETRLQQDLQQDKGQIEHLDYQIKRLNEELFEQKQVVEDQTGDVGIAKTELDRLQEQQRAAREKHEDFKTLNQAIQNQTHALEKELAVLSIQKEALEQECDRSVHDTEIKESERSECTLKIFELEQQLANQQEQFDISMRHEEELQRQIQRIEEEITQTKDRLQQESRIADAKQNEYNLTKSMVDNLEGFPESIRFLKKHAGWKKTPPLLSDILFCQQDYRVAIENYLEPVMNHYVVESRLEAAQAIQLLSDSSQGRANFFILEAIRDLPPNTPSQSGENLIPAIDAIRVEETYQPLVWQLLHQVFLLKSEDGHPLSAPLPDDGRVILQSDGLFSISQLGISGGSVGLFEGKRIGRAKNLEQLAQEINSLTKNNEKQQTELTLLNDQLHELRDRSQKMVIDEQRLQLNVLQNKQTSLRARQEQYHSFIEDSRGRKATIEQKLLDIRLKLETAQPELNTLQSKTEKNQVEGDQLEQTYRDISELLREKTAIFNQENIQFHQQQNKVASLARDLEFRESQKDLLEERTRKFTTEFNQISSQLRDALLNLDNNDTDLGEMYAQKELLESGLKDTEDDFYRSRKAIHEVEEEWATLRKSRDLADTLITEFKDRKTDLQIDLNGLKERLSVEFDIDLKDLLEMEIPEKRLPAPDLELLCKKLKKQLDDYGSINPMAKETYDDMNQRHGFIVKEKADLLEAKGSLLHTINEIDQSANDKFMLAYNTVRENFVKVFRSLFNEEDACDLVLSDPDNPLESDVDIIARPKGKRPLSINQLSGGEKTLTATALLFSLYLLKPAPFCIFDEVDAPLDDTNIDKFNNIIREFSKQSQFIIVSHNKRTIASTDIIYGVTMVEQGISRLVAVDLRDVA